MTQSYTTTETWSGAHTATLTAGPPVAQWTVATDRSEVSQIIDNGTELSEFSFFFPGKPMTTNYVGVDGGVNCTVLASLKANLDGWLANHNNAAAPDLGECSLTLTSVTEKADVGSQKKYTVHGSVAAVLPARSGAATGTVNFAASF